MLTDIHLITVFGLLGSVEYDVAKPANTRGEVLANRPGHFSYGALAIGIPSTENQDDDRTTWPNWGDKQILLYGGVCNGEAVLPGASICQLGVN